MKISFYLTKYSNSILDISNWIIYFNNIFTYFEINEFTAYDLFFIRKKNLYRIIKIKKSLYSDIIDIKKMFIYKYIFIYR
jgi:hypothetical protein